MQSTRNMTSSINLPFLPNELWDSVFSFVRPIYNNEDQTGSNELWGSTLSNPYNCPWGGDIEPPATLVSLCLVSKRFCHLAQPHLYKTIRLHDNVTSLQLLSTLIRQLSLGQYVEKIVHKGSWTSPRRVVVPQDVEPLCTTVSDAFDAAQSSLVLPEKLRECFYHGIKNYYRGALLALVIAYCPMVVQLDLNVGYGEAFQWKVLQEVAGAPKVEEQSHFQLLSAGHLSKLRKLRLATSHTPFYKLPSLLTTPFDLPNLNTLICDFTRGPWREHKMTINPEKVQLRHLTLTEPKMCFDQLMNLFNKAPELRVLEMKLDKTIISSSNKPTTLNQVGDALRDIGESRLLYGGSSLETLVIHSDYHISRSEYRIGSLELLVKLKRLSIDLRDLVGLMTTEHRYDDWHFSSDGPDIVFVAQSAKQSPPLTIDSLLPDTLEVLEIQYDRNYIHWVLEYFHQQATLMIANDKRVNLNRVILQCESYGFVKLAYTRNVDQGWTITTRDSELRVELSKTLDACPMVASGFFTIAHDERVDEVERMGKVDPEDQGPRT